MKILITGANGQLGYDLIRVLSRNHQIVAKSRKELDVTHSEKVKSTLQELMPDIVIHAAAYTKVDQAETDREAAFLVNAYGTRNVAAASESIKAKLVYVSTDYVFDGYKGEAYHEFDVPHPLSVYGQSKYAGEQFVQSLHQQYFIVRTSWLYGKSGGNFVTKILKLASEGKSLAVVENEWGSPTYTYDLADFIQRAILTDKFGIYHASNAGACSRFEFAQSILHLAGYENEITPVSSSVFSLPAARPVYSSFDHMAVRLNGFPAFRKWKEGLAAFLVNDLSIREVRHTS